ncbi:N-acetylglucosamine-6-phosphate deacetylase [Sphingomonas sp. Leaf357]|uniref:N-acetylglucosamine-6-phosphate deacetylase n=1 Tax=Sphingomonas sp. Leaf357 TaxID=1736350 RepID=UPI0006FD23B4|nr:N-acetylglucosamine-6-phosphate deacetylase [Sphingomonas sp. Leaf357]KQS04701.1 N-acetylglucosamine-6-phosphate deacetylase [Sphingomonas sp. Leaf357]
MSMMRFSNGTVLTADGALDGATITLEDDRIAAIAPLAGFNGDAIDLDGGWLVPGFVDTQVNGGGGVLLNDAPTVAGIAAIGAAHATYGTTALMPTLISDTPDVIAATLDAMDAAIVAAVPGVIGAHIEGPWINLARKGIHDPAKFRRLDEAMIALLTRPRSGRVMVTLAPELTDPATIARLVAAGVIVSAGHTDADYETTVAAIAAGMTGITHLFNAMSPLLHRAPGVVGATLDDRQVYCGLIADGLHVHDAALRLALNARPHDRLMLVSDAMPSVGAVEKDFWLQGRLIQVSDGKCVGEDGTLAGSDLDMAGAVRNLVQRTGAGVATAVAMASTNPAAFLGLSHERGALAPGLRADWVRLSRDLAPVGTWIGGVKISDGV